MHNGAVVASANLGVENMEPC